MKRLERLAAEGNAAVQMVLPLAETLGWLRRGVGELIRQAGLQLMELMMEEEVRTLAGERSQPQPERRANRHRGEPLTGTLWEKLMLGLSTRKYGQAVREFTEAYGLEKSAVSERFMEASRQKLKELMERRLDKLNFCALLAGATPFEGQQMVVALGITQAAVIQRCQVHKRRNVFDHLTEEQQPAVAKKLNAAYALQDYREAKQALNHLHRELMDLNPSAARSLAEALEETLTVHRLRIPLQLRQTLASTNVIESAFPVVERVCRTAARFMNMGK